MSIKKLLAATYLVSTFILTICPPGIEEAHATDSFDSHNHELSDERHSESESHEHFEEKKAPLSYVEKNECEGEQQIIAANALIVSRGFSDLQCPALPITYLKHDLFYEIVSIQRMPEKIDKPPPIFVGIHTIVVRE